MQIHVYTMLYGRLELDGRGTYYLHFDLTVYQETKLFFLKYINTTFSLKNSLLSYCPE